MCVDVACVGNLYKLGHVELLETNQLKVTASVTDPLVHAVVNSFIVLDPHS